MNYDIDTVKNVARNQWLSIVTSLCGVAENQLDNRHKPCPKCGGNDRFRAFDDFNETGGVICNPGSGCGTFADGIATVAWLNDCEFIEALQLVGDFVNAPKPIKSTKAKSKPAKSRKRSNASGRNTSRGTAKAKTTKQKKAAEDLKIDTALNPNAISMFLAKSKRFRSLAVLEHFEAKTATYQKRVVVVAIPIKSDGEIVGYTIYPALTDGIPYRNEMLSKQTVMI